MVKIYYNLIIKKEKTIDEVPASIRQQVLKLLNENGYDGYGEILEIDTQYDTNEEPNLENLIKS